MADKQQNILVNFKYNTAELERAQGIVNRANEANNRLQQSAQKAGEGSSQAYRGATQSIVAMQNQLTRLKSIIEVTTDPKKVAQLSAQYKQLKAQLDATNKAYFEQAKVTKEVAANTKSLGQNFGQLYSAIRLVLAGGIVKELVSVSINMAALAGNVEGVERAFRRAFPNAESLLSELKDATHDTVSEFELMQRTLQATNLGVAVEQLPILFEFAAARAQQTGESVDYLVDSIVRGIGRKSILVLDNLGLSATRLKEQFNGASLASQSVGDVTIGVANIAREELGKMGGYVETAATQVGELKADFKDLQSEIATTGEGVNTWIVQKLDEAVKGAQLFLKVLQQAREDQPTTEQDLTEEGFKDFIKRLTTGESTFTKVAKEEEAKRQAIREEAFFRQTQLTDEIQKDQQKSLSIIDEEVKASQSRIDRNVNEQNSMRERITLLTDYLKLTATEEERVKSLNFFNKQVAQVAEQQNVSRREARKIVLAQIEDGRKQLEFYDFQNMKIREYIVLLGESGEALKKNAIDAKPEIETLETLREKLKDLKEQIEDTPTSELGVMKSLEKEADKVQKKIDKIISDLYFLDKQAPEVTITVTTKPESDLSAGIPLADGGLTSEEMAELLKNDTVERTSQAFEKSRQKAEDFRKELERLIKTIPDLVPPAKYTQDQLEQMVDSTELFNARLRDAFKEAKTDFEVTGIDIFADQLKSFEDAEVQSLQNRLNALRNFYDEQTLLAGDNERAKKELRLKEERETAALQKKIAQREKEARRFSVIIDTAAGIARAFATAPNIAVAIVQAALVAAQGASQLAIINRTVPRFAKGVIDLKGPGTGTSDSIDAKLSRGESVMTNQETKSSRGILKDIRAKRLDDKVLQNLKLTADGVKYVGMDDSRLLKKLDEIKNAQPDIVNQHGQLYRQFTKGSDYKKKVRLKNLGY